jgi:hypothetical protein
VVDDEVPILDMMQQHLRKMGYRVTTLADSPEAMKTFRAAPDHFDLVITDHTMPGLQGADLAEELGAIRSRFAGHPDDRPEPAAGFVGFTPCPYAGGFPKANQFYRAVPMPAPIPRPPGWSLISIYGQTGERCQNRRMEIFMPGRPGAKRQELFQPGGLPEPVSRCGFKSLTAVMAR